MSLKEGGEQKLLAKEEVIALRKKYIAPSLSIHYSDILPLKIVYGRGLFLYDEKDQPYLDCINNVTHVGHSHTRVADVLTSQMSLLDSSPYSTHSHLSTYTQHLLSHFPPSLNYVLFTTSGSEANDLALSISEVVTGGSDVLVVDGAYHGHTRPLLSLSSYKVRQQSQHPDQPPAITLSPHVSVCTLPDPYRGKFGGQDDAGLKYASEVGEAVAKVQAAGRKVSCFLSEAFLSCAGQVELPHGYLPAVYKLVREAGGVCISDEVQTGFGRAGKYFWMFESQGVCPDMVTIGKPMGNGHPISAVVTTKEIARKYLKATQYRHWAEEYCSDPVSLSVADTVLSIIEEERLQENAEEVGQYLLDNLRALMSLHQAIGDVRGCGLFIGVELVLDRVSKEPDAKLCKALVHRMLLDHHILVQSDGLDHNIIKLKPPLIFSLKEAATFLQAFNLSLTQLTST